MSKPCSKRDELFSRWTAASNALSDLEAGKIGAVRDKDPEFAQWDTRMQEAQAAERLTQPPDQLASLRLQRHDTLPEWNYTINPQL